MARMVACCAACVRHSAKRRPRMTQVKFHFTLKIKTHISIDEDSSRNELQPSTIESKLKSTMFDALVNIQIANLDIISVILNLYAILEQVLRALEGDVSLSDLNEGIKPGHSTVYSSYTSSDYDTLQYNEDMKKFRKMALATSQEYASSDQYSNPTSEYGLNPSGSSSEGHQTAEMETGRMRKDSRGFSGSKGFSGTSQYTRNSISVQSFQPLTLL